MLCWLESHLDLCANLLLISREFCRGLKGEKTPQLTTWAMVLLGTGMNPLEQSEFDKPKVSILMKAGV